MYIIKIYLSYVHLEGSQQHGIEKKKHLTVRCPKSSQLYAKIIAPKANLKKILEIVTTF